MKLSDLKKNKIKEAGVATLSGAAGYAALMSGLSFILNASEEAIILGCGAGFLYMQCKSSLAKAVNDKVEKVTKATNKYVAEMYHIERKTALNASAIDGFFLAWGIKDVYDGITMNNPIYLVFGSGLLLWAGKRAFNHYNQAKKTSVNEYEVYQFIKSNEKER